MASTEFISNRPEASQLVVTRAKAQATALSHIYESEGTMNAPTFPMAGLLVFWGGIQNGFWAFGHNPTEYAKRINCPTLLLYGQQDEKVSKVEIDEIFANLTGRKELKIYKNVGHENYLTKYKDEWTNDIEQFINTK